LWALIEWLRSLGQYGVTGGGLSYSQAEFLPVLQIAAILGSYGISFFIVFVNEAVAEATIEKNLRKIGLALIVMIIVLLFGSYHIGAYKEQGKPIKVAVIQANISQDVKLDFGYSYEIVNMHANLSKMALSERPDVIIWPETAITTYLFETNAMLTDVKKLVKDSKTIYIIGTPLRYRDKIYNSVVAFSKDGSLLGRYDKQRLVPFGEYLPLRPVFYPLLGKNPLFTEDYNGNPKANVVDIGIAKVGVVVCFESTFPYLVKDKVKKGAQFILVATNDAWFFDSSALYQHIQAARMRAVENNMFVVQAANTGISAIIDPVGRIVKRSPPKQATVLIGKIFIH
jgi:apolipoprotein N-acyltransferase